MTVDSLGAIRPAGIRRSQAYSQELESLRGWAILLVVLFHADSAVFPDARVGSGVTPFLAFITAGHTGVTLFFLLSALLLARPLVRPASQRRRFRPREFGMRRFLRIMPLYAVAVFVSVLLCLDRPGAIAGGVESLFFVSSFVGVSKALLPYSAVWWSLATEVQFYAVLAIVGCIMDTRLGKAAIAAGLVVWGIAYYALINDPSLTSLNARFLLLLSVVGRLPIFLFGIGIAWLTEHHGERIRASLHETRWIRMGGADAFLLGALAALGLILARVTAIGFFRAELVWQTWHVWEGALWAVVVLLVTLAPLRLGPLISNRSLAWIGMLAYSLYLIHEPVIHYGFLWLQSHSLPLIDDLGLRVVAIAAVVSLCTAASAITYRFIERPFLVRKARIDS